MKQSIVVSKDTNSPKSTDFFTTGCEVGGWLEIDIGVGMEMRRLKEIYSEKITLFSDMDFGNIISRGSVYKIREIHSENQIIAQIEQGTVV